MIPHLSLNHQMLQMDGERAVKMLLDALYTVSKRMILKLKQSLLNLTHIVSSYQTVGRLCRNGAGLPISL